MDKRRDNSPNMEATALRRAAETKRAIELVIRSGERVCVPHPEFMSFAPNPNAPDADTVIVWDEVNAPVWLDLASITAIDFRAPKTRCNGGKRGRSA
ncbi:MAG: hypothetical protein QOE70_691 [Chthoniobacter sp.]|jgi:hypothetical protein|nr:hypothetical protein [Chthoniobacter sp.]